MLARALTATVLVALTLAGCGSSEVSPDAATAGTVTATSLTRLPAESSTTEVLETTTTAGAADTPQAASTTQPASTIQPAGTTQPAGTVAAAAPATTTAVTPTPSSLQFNVPLVGGGQLDGSTLAGKPIAFWFWAPT